MLAITPWIVFSCTIVVVLVRPRVAGAAAPPALLALVGACAMLSLDALRAADVEAAARALWRPLVGVASIIVSASIARRVGLLDAVIAAFARAARESVSRAFAVVFASSYAFAALLNNDAAVLVLAPAVAAASLRLYPERQRLVVPFSFAVFSAAGVAPLVLSNPMNLVVATRCGLGFNAYAARMIPASLVVAAVTYTMLRWHFNGLFEDDFPATGAFEAGVRRPLDRGALALFALTLAAHPVCSALGGPTWAVALAGTTALAAYAAWRKVIRVGALVGEVEWGILAFLFGMFLQVEALRHAGLTERTRAVYASISASDGSRSVGVAMISALGSAILNNHPMALVNAAALRGSSNDARRDILAALVGGDLGPRLLPIGSLAGLFWFEALRREGVRISFRGFALVGLVTTIPSVITGALVVEVLSR